MSGHTSPHLGASGQIVWPNDTHRYDGYCVGCSLSDERHDGPRYAEAIRGANRMRHYAACVHAERCQP